MNKQAQDDRDALNEALASLRAEMAAAHEKSLADREARVREAADEERKRQTDELYV